MHRRPKRFAEHACRTCKAPFTGAWPHSWRCTSAASRSRGSPFADQAHSAWPRIVAACDTVSRQARSLELPGRARRECRSRSVRTPKYSKSGTGLFGSRVASARPSRTAYGFPQESSSTPTDERGGLLTYALMLLLFVLMITRSRYARLRVRCDFPSPATVA